MRSRILLSIGLLACVGTISAATPKTDKIAGDYVEARTASVFAGACHYNGEVVTTGYDAVMAWNFASGTWKGTDLAGLRAMAEVSSQSNLGDDTAPRKSELVVDASATHAQVAALVDFLRTDCGKQLGQIVSVHRTDVTFDRVGREYRVQAKGFGEMDVQPMANDECCTQPELVWYSPLMQLEHRKVGYTITSSYVAGTIGDPWQRSDENSAFYGAFAF